MKILLRDFRRYEKNTLQAFCDLEIIELHLVIKGCTVHQKNGRAWIGFPGRPYKEDGETKWANILEFSDDEIKEDFRRAAVEVISKHVEKEKIRDDKPDESDDFPF